MTACDICKAAQECADWQADNKNQKPSAYLCACEYRIADEYKECTGE